MMSHAYAKRRNFGKRKLWPKKVKAEKEAARKKKVAQSEIHRACNYFARRQNFVVSPTELLDRDEV